MVDFLGIHFAGFGRMVLLPFFVVAAVFVLRVLVIRLRAARLLVHPAHAGFLFKHFSFTRERAKAACMVGALGLFFLAMLLPQWGKKEEQVIQEGRDLLIVLDISRSMLAQDLRPDRLSFAKLKVRSLLQMLKTERVGLVLFSGSAFLHCPLTSDYGAFLSYLEQVDVETISSGSTALDQALGKAIEVFARGGERKNKLVLLLTDGEDFSTDFSFVKAKAREERIKLFALGMGSPEGAPIPRLDFRGNQIGHEVDEQGGTALTKLNEALLKEATQELGGLYLRATADDRDLVDLVSAVEQHEKERFEDRKIALYEHRYHWFLLGALLLLACEWIL